MAAGDPYVLPEQVRRRAGADQENTDGILTDDAILDEDIEEYIAERQAEVDSMLSPRYSVPFNQNGDPVPLQVFRIVRDLACADSIDQAMAKSFGDKRHPYAERLEQKAMSLLDELAYGSGSLAGLSQNSRIFGQLAPLDPRNLLPESRNRAAYDPTAPDQQLPTNAAGQQDSDLLTP